MRDYSPLMSYVLAKKFIKLTTGVFSIDFLSSISHVLISSLSPRSPYDLNSVPIPDLPWDKYVSATCIFLAYGQAAIENGPEFK